MNLKSLITAKTHKILLCPTPFLYQRCPEIRPIVDRVMPLESAADAHRLVESEQRRGAIVLEV